MDVPPIGLDRNLTGATAEQRQVHDLIAEGPRGSVPSPFFAMMDTPALAAAIQEVGVVIRFKGHLSDAQRELAILATAGAVRCGYEWNYHAPIAKKAAVASSLIDATLAQNIPDGIDPSSAIIIQLCRRVAVDRRLQPELLEAAINAFGRPGTTELIAIAGYYSLLASFIIIGDHDQPFELVAPEPI